MLQPEVPSSSYSSALNATTEFAVAARKLVSVAARNVIALFEKQVGNWHDDRHCIESDADMRNKH
jgi:hypothetical protein